MAESPPSPAQTVEAALAGIAHRVADGLEAAGRAARNGEILLSGPLAAIPALAQFQADVTGRPVRIAIEPEATLFGIARIAVRAHGETPPAAARAGRALAPRTAPTERRALRRRWAAAVAASRGD
jgi:sugar (pentulose or hexulose) kinase